jgi:hypothetical protein
MTNLDADIANRIKAKGQPETPSRIEEINAKLAELNRQHHELDDLLSTFEVGDDRGRSLIKIRSDAARALIGDDMQSLVEVLAMERPTTAREVLIFALHAISPVLEAVSAIPSKNAYETSMAVTANRLLRGMIPALEALSGTSRADLGYGDGFYRDSETNDELVEGLKVPLKTEASL